MFIIINRNSRTTSLTSFRCFYCWLWTYFTPFSSVSIINFEQVNVSWIYCDVKFIININLKHFRKHFALHIQKAYSVKFLNNHGNIFWNGIFRSSCPDVFCERGILRNFTKLTGNTCARVSFLIKLKPQACNFI